MATDPIDTTTRRRVTLDEAAKIARAIFLERLAAEEEARKREAEYWQALDDDETCGLVISGAGAV